MPYADPNKQRDYVRNWQRNKRSEGLGGSVVPTLDWQLESAESLKAVLEVAITDLMEAGVDPAVKGRVLASLVQTAIKLLEVSDLEARVAAIERKLFQRSYA